ncbi:diuretic hormone receptor-like isoform X3 [Zophobas morio]|uniref:diuretic hormone receptor-like isoform X3 n=1 Tax=Zophobas morio TaxID=2755281 RepID=UPI003082FB4F
MSLSDSQLAQEPGPLDQTVSLSVEGENEWNDTEDIKLTLNITETHCKTVYANKTAALAEINPDGFCPVTTDGLLCWPPTPINETTYVKCFAELMSIKYDDTQNATRMCLANATWTKADYSKCTEIILIPDVETQATIYFVGYVLSLITLSIALGIFTYFKELRCLRNRIHMNLMWSYMLMYCMWIVTLTVLSSKDGASIACIFIITLLHYFHISTFFWMFVEGLYLYILVVETLTRENFKLRVYVGIGWGLPMVFILIWAVVKSFIPSDADPSSCTWFNSHAVDWIYQGPTLAILLLNLAFLLAIMWVLITKLRSANTVETQQYHKAAKALLVLMPLLGITYVITMYAPTPDKKSEMIFECVRAVLLSTQGFTVALFYCFLNTEVQNTVRHHFETWKTRRSLGPSRLRSGSRSKDWSPRSRTESIRQTRTKRGRLSNLAPSNAGNHTRKTPP